MAATRKPNGASSIYQGADGYWHGRVTVGVKDDGRSDRRHVMSKSQERAVMGIVGWSHSAMAARYQHVTGAIQRDVAARVDSLIWNNG